MKGSSVSVGALLDQKGRSVYSVAPSATVYSAIEQMAYRGVGALAVIDGDRLVGVFSERDYSRKVILAGRSSKETPVVDIMSADVVTVTPSASVGECLRLMTDHKVRHLPVIAEDRVVGMISIGDLVKQVIAEQEETIDRLHSYISGAYPN